MTLRYCVTLRPGALIKQHQKRRCDVCFAPCSYAGCTPFCGRHSRLSAESPPTRGAGPVHEQTRLVWSPNRPRIGCPTPNPHSIDRQSSIQVASCLKAIIFLTSSWGRRSGGVLTAYRTPVHTRRGVQIGMGPSFSDLRSVPLVSKVFSRDVQVICH